ncbi:signal-regulatory protein beta-1-like [Pithys albifrons albifrons]|uniref:signal-regulatory protein beta-1-like n=1 Tax=Pithys albifrons albifrons TaxID=3385563 RepID=UPI003A5CB44C
MAPATQALPLPCLMLLLLCRALGVVVQTGQDFKLHQPQDKVSVRAGETLTLNCTVSGAIKPGPVKWLKGWGSDNKTFYDNTDTYPRVTRAVKGSNTDFTIHIRNVQPEDIGTYYCVKFQLTLRGGIQVLQRGSGTEVSVQAGVIFLPSLLLLLFGILLEKVLLSGLLFFLFNRMQLNMSGMVPCPAPSQSPVPPGRSQGLVTTSHL